MGRRTIVHDDDKDDIDEDISTFTAKSDFLRKGFNSNDQSNEDDDIFVLYVKPASVNLGGSNKNNPITVEKYSDDDDGLQQAIMASLLSVHGSSNKRSANLWEDDDDVHVLGDSMPRKIFKGESSNSKSKDFTSGIDAVVVDPATFVCDICVDEKPMSLSFRIEGCNHFYCSDCISKYVASKLQENINNISCPFKGCEGKLEPRNCRSILPCQVFDRWGDALCEALILASEKFYCPYKDCSSLLINDDSNAAGGEGAAAVQQSECPECHRLFCAQCKVAWHSEVSCEEYQKLNKDEREREDILLMKLANGKRWNWCPNCRSYVEKTGGCPFVRCRCGSQFHYY